jgi:hypothetical protein
MIERRRSMGKWDVSNSRKTELIQDVAKFITELEESYTKEGRPFVDKDFTGKATPHELVSTLEYLGYKETARNVMKQELDFWVIMKKECTPSISVEGIGMLHEVRLSEVV